MNNKYFYLILLLALLVACSVQNGKPSAEPPERFIAFYADYLVMQEDNVANGRDSVQANLMLDSIYAKHSYTREEVEQIRKSYNNDIAAWHAVYDKVTARIDSIQLARQTK